MGRACEAGVQDTKVKKGESSPPFSPLLSRDGERERHGFSHYILRSFKQHAVTRTIPPCLTFVKINVIKLSVELLF